MFAVAGIAIMMLGAALVTVAALFETHRLTFERCGGSIFLVGLVTLALYWRHVMSF